MEAYTKPGEEILKQLKVDASKGLDKEGVMNSRKQYGSNQFCTQKRKTILVRLTENLREPMVII